jgi:hypothetical protein
MRYFEDTAEQAAATDALPRRRAAMPGPLGTPMGRLLCFRSAILVVATAASVPVAARADVLPPIKGEESDWAVLSLEGVASLEHPLGGQKSLSLWETLGNVARL